MFSSFVKEAFFLSAVEGAEAAEAERKEKESRLQLRYLEA